MIIIFDRAYWVLRNLKQYLVRLKCINCTFIVKTINDISHVIET